MAFRKSFLEKVDGFDPNFGRIGSGMGSMEDTLIQKHLHETDSKVWYVAHAEVLHFVPMSRCRLRYFYDRQYGHRMSELMSQDADHDISYSAVLLLFTRGLLKLARVFAGFVFRSHKQARYVMSFAYECATLAWVIGRRERSNKCE